MNPQDPKYQLKSKAVTSAEPNYFVHFAMRHPVKDEKKNTRKIRENAVVDKIKCLRNI